jgi:LacI family transcriptional regulator
MVDVARLAGVSVSTVSHVINETRPVRSSTRALVLAAVQETGYSHNSIARALARTHTKTIGLTVSVPTNAYFSDLVHAVDREAAHGGYTLLLSDSQDDPEEELRVVRALCERRVDGIILAVSPDPGLRAVRFAAERGVSVLLIDRMASEEFDQIGVENAEPTARLAGHLAELGHRRIGMVAGLDGLTTSRERVDGYRLGLHRAGLPYAPELLLTGSSLLEPARLALHRLLDLPRPPTALVVGNNLMTIGVMKGLHERGRRVPEDIALVSFDDFEWADVFHPRLTTIAQPIEQLGRTAVRLLISRMAEPGRPPVTLRLQPGFRHRESCGCPRDVASGLPQN